VQEILHEPMFRPSPAVASRQMFHGHNDLGQKVLGGVDLVIDLATLGEFGLEPLDADGCGRERAERRSRPSRRPGWEALAPTLRAACGERQGHTVRPARRVRGNGAFAFPTSSASTPADVRGALERYAA
jgi:hypothetical protein